MFRAALQRSRPRAASVLAAGAALGTFAAAVSRHRGPSSAASPFDGGAGCLGVCGGDWAEAARGDCSCYAVQPQRLFSSEAADVATSQTLSQLRSLRGSVILISDVLSAAECALLRDEADGMLDGGTYRRDRYCDDDDEEEDVSDDGDDGLRRLSLCDMSPEARYLSDTLLRRRVLPTLRRSAPLLCRDLGLGGFDDPGAAFDWAADEPSVNRYVGPGGRFDPHRDGYPLTVIVPLSEEGSFEGGGTEFFEGSPRQAVGGGGSEDDNSGFDKEDDVKADADGARGMSVIVRPPRGTAVLFDGDVTHAGAPVVSGKRHLYVASFGIE